MHVCEVQKDNKMKENKEAKCCGISLSRTSEMTGIS